MLQYLSKILYILSGSRLQLGLLIASFIFASLLEALGVGLIAPFLSIAADPSIARDSILKGSLQFLNLNTDSQIITGLALILILVFCIKTAVYFLCKLYILKYSYWQKNQLESRLMSTYLRIPYIFHLNKNSAALINNIAIEAHQFTTNSLIPLLEIVANVIVMSVLLALLAYSEISLLIVALVIILPTILLFARLSRRVKGWGKIMSTANDKMISSINHGLGGLKETKVIGCEDHFEQELDLHSKAYAQAAVKAESFRVLPRVSIEAILVIFLLVFIVFSQLVSGRSLSELTSVMGMFAVASIRLVPAVSQILCSLGQIRFSTFALDKLCLDLKEIERFSAENHHRQSQSNGAVRKVFNGAAHSVRDEFNGAVNGSNDQINGSINGSANGLSNGLANGHLEAHLEERPASDRSASDKSASLPLQPMPFNYEVALEDITYRYPASEKPAITNFSLTLRKGESIALVGKSGSGKTTLVDILLGLLEPEQGDIKVDGRSVYSDIRAWQNLLGYIPQSIFLTDSTIEQNIAYGVPVEEIDPVRLQQAIASAQLEDLVSKMPDGVKTEVGERGVRVSGGQRQRIGIARALYHGREILVLDEATSALDHETEQLVSAAINSLAGSKTLIIIAHRFSTIERCDRIYELSEGQLKQSGTYSEVIAAK